MLRYILVRVLWLIPVIILVSFIVFSLMEAAPGTIVDAIIAQAETLTPEGRDELIRMHNLDRSMFYRYGVYMLNLVRGDMGVSDFTGLNVWNMFIARLPNTLILSFAALFIGSTLSIPIGIVAARKAGTITDNAVTVFSLVGMSMPLFWLGLLLLLLFAQQLEWLPAGGFNHGIRSLILPAICSSAVMLAVTARQTRSNVLEVLKADYLRTARAKGVPENAVIRKHALGNAWIPIITSIGSSLAGQLAGAVVVEVVFAWPGIGRMAAEAVMARDITTATGVIIMTTLMYVIVMLVVDLLYAFVDPRIKSQYKAYGARKKKNSAPAKVTKAVSAPAAAVQSGKPAEVLHTGKTPPVPEPVSAATVEIAEEEPAEVKTAHVSYVTREIGVTKRSYDAQDEKDKPTADVVLASRAYKKRSQMSEIFHHMRKNKGAMAGLIIIGLLFLTFIASLFISWDSIIALNVNARFQSPNLQFPFGADQLGRNAFLRVIYGTRYSLGIGFGAVLISALIGVTAGCFAGYYGGKADDIIMRLSDVLASIPGLLMGMVIVTVLGQSLMNLILAVGVTGAPVFLRMTRASILTVRNSEFVEAARAVGLSNFRIIFSQVLPNGLSPIIVTATASLGIAIIVASSLSFLGFGVPIPHPEWGSIIASGREYTRSAPWLVTFPGIFIMLTVLAFNLLGDGLRDALDPKLKMR